MTIEFEKRIASLNGQIEDEKKSQPVNYDAIARLEAILGEVERLYAFYRQQIAERGHPHSHEYKEG